MMADKDKNEKRIDKPVKPKLNAFQKIAAFFVKTGKRLKTFFQNLKAELKRVVWPDRKRLIQNTATVLAICISVGVLLYVIDSILAGVLNATGFYTPKTTAAPTTAATTAETTTAGSDTAITVTTGSGSSETAGATESAAATTTK